MSKRELEMIGRLDMAYRSIAFSPDMMISTKIRRLRESYRQAWLDSCRDTGKKSRVSML